MWTKWRECLFPMTWFLLHVSVCGLKQKTVCHDFVLVVDPPCGATEMLLPTMFTLGVSSDVTCHSEIAGALLLYKSVDEKRRCCQQRENDNLTEYCLPAMKNQLTNHYYQDLVDSCTASTKCQLPTKNTKVPNTGGEDYVTFTYECVHKDTVLHIQQDSTHTGQEVYLYNDQHDGEAHANCIAYSHECNSHVIIQLAATRVVSPACHVISTDENVSVQMDCKNVSASSNCPSTMFESKSNYVNMSFFMTVDPGRQEREFVWIRAKGIPRMSLTQDNSFVADTGNNVTVVCGANIPSDVSLNCPTSTPTTATTTTTTDASTNTTAATPVSTFTTTATSTSTSNATTITVSASISNIKKIPGTSPVWTPQNLQPSDMTSAGTMVSHNSNSAPTQQNRFPKPTSLTNGESPRTLPITLGVSAAVLFVGFGLGWIMSRCYYQRKTKTNDAVVYNTPSTMNEEHAYSTVQPTSTATYANTSYEYYNQ